MTVSGFIVVCITYPAAACGASRLLAEAQCERWSVLWASAAVARSACASATVFFNQPQPACKFALPATGHLPPVTRHPSLYIGLRSNIQPPLFLTMFPLHEQRRGYDLCPRRERRPERFQ